MLGELKRPEERQARVRAARISTVGDIPLLAISHAGMSLHLEHPNLVIAAIKMEKTERQWLCSTLFHPSRH